MGSHAVSPEEAKKMIENQLKEEGIRFSRFLTKSRDYEEKKTEFIENVIGSQSALNLAQINKLNQIQSLEKRVGILAEGKIKGNPVYLSINDQGDFIYDVFKKGKCLSMFVKKDLGNFIGGVGLRYELDLLSEKERTSYASSAVLLDEMKSGELNHLPEEAVQRMTKIPHNGFNTEQAQKLDQFINTFLFAGTDLKATRQEWIKNKAKQSKKRVNKLKEEDQKYENPEKIEKFVNAFETKKVSVSFFINKIKSFGSKSL